MRPDKIVVIVNVLDNADILNEYIEWYLSLNVDFILAHDFGSTDGSQDILDSLARKGVLKWSFHPNKSIVGYDPSAQLARTARDQYDADWVILCDTDEFLCVNGGSLRGVLQAATNNEVSVLNVPCFNMTGPAIRPDRHALETLNLRIDRSVKVSHEEILSGELRVPYIFIGHPPKTIVRASRFVEYGPGAHSAETSTGVVQESTDLRFLHYAIRGYPAFQTKVANIATWMAENTHLEPWWGWHWRRWIRLNASGRLREDYDAQFLSRARARAAIRDGTCTRDDTVADWMSQRPTAVPRTWGQKLLARLFG